MSDASIALNAITCHRHRERSCAHFAVTLTRTSFNVLQVAAETADGRLVSVLEGGYHVERKAPGHDRARASVRKIHTYQGTFVLASESFQVLGSPAPEMLGHHSCANAL